MAVEIKTPSNLVTVMTALEAMRRRRIVADLLRRKAMHQIHRPGR